MQPGSGRCAETCLTKNIKKGLWPAAYMDDKLRRQFEKMEDLRKRLFAELSAIDPQKLQAVPASGKWSPSQEIGHLIMAEMLAVRTIQPRLQPGIKNGKSDLVNYGRSILLQIAMWSPFKIKAPQMVAKIPEGQTLEKLAGDYERVRTKFKELLEAFPPERLNETVFKHPVVGLLDIYEALDFCIDHFERHAKSIRKKL